MSDPRITDDIAIDIARRVNANEDARDEANGDLKSTWSDARETLKGLGLTGAEISAEVAKLKLAIGISRCSADDKAKATAKAEGAERYLAIITAPRARARARRDRDDPQDYINRRLSARVVIVDEPDTEPLGGEPSIANEAAPASLSATPGGPADGAEPDLAPVSSATQSGASSEAGRSRQEGESRDGLKEPPASTQSTAPRSDVGANTTEASGHGQRLDPVARTTLPAGESLPVDTIVTPFVANPRRPLCKRPEMCGGYGPRHCGADGLTCQATAAMAITAGGAEIEHQGFVG